MLRNIRELEEYAVCATDGNIGRVTDFYFDDDRWVIRYLLAALDEETPRRKVLISPIAIGELNWTQKLIPVALSREQVLKSPDIDTDKPISRQHELGYLGYYGYGKYWGGGGLWGAGMYPDILQAGLQAGESNSPPGKHHRSDPHLRSGNAVMRYYVHASDGDIGHVQGLLIDDRSWAIRYFVVNTSNWWLGHQVIIAPSWIDSMSWSESTVNVGITRQALKDAPPYDPSVTIDREHELGIHRHYGRRSDWLERDPGNVNDGRHG